MLVDPHFWPYRQLNPILAAAAVGAVNFKKLAVGLYRINHFSFDTLISRDGGNLRDHDEWLGYLWASGEKNPPFEDFLEYGVCDGPLQFMQSIGAKLYLHEREFCVSLTRIAKSEQSEGGWRWHKWGPYIGKQEPTTEYLRDEPLIEEVWCFHVFMKKNKQGV